MATAKNKLPTFAELAEVDESIVNNTSDLNKTGFQPNTTIKSIEMNTYMKMLINGMRGLIDSVYDSGVSQGEIKATSSADEVKDYILTGLNQIIKTNKVDNATHADEATNVDSITNNDTGNNANVNFSIGDQTFSKTINNVSNANQASKLSQARTISLTGDTTGSTSFDGSGNASISTKLKNPMKISSGSKFVELAANDSSCHLIIIGGNNTRMKYTDNGIFFQNDDRYISNFDWGTFTTPNPMSGGSVNSFDVSFKNGPAGLGSWKVIATPATYLDNGIDVSITYTSNTGFSINIRNNTNSSRYISANWIAFKVEG